MKENEETKIYANTVGWLLRILTACPQVVKKGIGAEEFAKELINSCLELDTYFSDYFGAMNSFLPFVEVCPQIYNPETGIKTYLEELGKAAIMFEKKIKQPNV